MCRVGSVILLVHNITVMIPYLGRVFIRDSDAAFWLFIQGRYHDLNEYKNNQVAEDCWLTMIDEFINIYKKG